MVGQLIIVLAHGLFRFIDWQKIFVVTGQSTLVLLANVTTIIVEQKFLSGKSRRIGVTCMYAYIEL